MWRERVSVVGGSEWEKGVSVEGVWREVHKGDERDL